MAVKVVSEGPVKVEKVMCSKCRYMLEYTGVDVKSRSYRSFDETETFHWIDCPNCKAEVRVKEWR